MSLPVDVAHTSGGPAKRPMTVILARGRTAVVENAREEAVDGDRREKGRREGRRSGIVSRMEDL